MSTFSQWWASYAAEKPAKQITWVCGPEHILVDFVVDATTERIGPSESNVAIVNPLWHSEREVWAALYQTPLDPLTPKVTIVRGAERIKNWQPFHQWLAVKRHSPKSFVILVSNDATVPRLEPEEKYGKGEPVPHVAAIIAARGHVIECKQFTQATAKRAVEWVQSLVPMRAATAGHLLNRANGDLRLVRDTAKKLAVLQEDVTVTAINLMLSEEPRDTFADALLLLDKKTALLAAEDIPFDEYSRTIGQLESSLTFAHRLFLLQAQNKSQGDIARLMGNRAFLVKEFLPVAKHYDEKNVQRNRKVLIVADEVVRVGRPEGVLEAIVANW